MDYVLAALVGCFVALGVYLLLSRSVIRMLLGMVVLGNGVNLLIFTAARLRGWNNPSVRSPIRCRRR